MKRESFILYAQHLKNLSKLSDEQAGRLLKAIFQHSQDEEELELDGITDMLFGIIADRMDADTEKYQDVIDKRSRAGKASAEARANKKQQTSTNSTNVNNVQQTSTNPTVYDNDNVNEYDNDIDISVSDKKEKKPKSSLYGKYKHVKLTKAQYDDAVEKYGKEETDFLIDEVDSYCERKKKTYGNYREAMATFVKRGALEDFAKQRSSDTPSEFLLSLIKNQSKEI